MFALRGWELHVASPACGCVRAYNCVALFMQFYLPGNDKPTLSPSTDKKVNILPVCFKHPRGNVILSDNSIFLLPH